MKTLQTVLMSLTLCLAGTQRPFSDELLIFTADWCGPCNKLKADLDAHPEMLQDYTWGFIDIDRDGELAERYDVKSVPALILVDSDNKEIKRRVGYENLETVRRWLAEKRTYMSLRKINIFTRKR